MMYMQQIVCQNSRRANNTFSIFFKEATLVLESELVV